MQTHYDITRRANRLFSYYVLCSSLWVGEFMCVSVMVEQSWCLIDWDSLDKKQVVRKPWVSVIPWVHRILVAGSGKLRNSRPNAVGLEHCLHVVYEFRDPVFGELDGRVSQPLRKSTGGRWH